MSAVPYARKAAAMLSRAGVGGGEPPADRRAEAIDAIAIAIEARARRRRRERVGTVAFGLAAAMLVGVLAWRNTPHPALVQATVAPASSVTVVAIRGALVAGGPAGAGAVLPNGNPIPEGTRLVAGQGGVTLALSTGTRLAVEANAEMTMVDEGATERFALEGGAVRADVAKLTPGQRFIVSTPDTEVEVHGTSFRVAVAGPGAAAACGGTRTRVTVYDGVVAVRSGEREIHVSAGEEWPAGCSELGHPPAAPSRPRLYVGAATAATAVSPVSHVAYAAASSAVTPMPSSIPARASTLAEQNDLFARATAEKSRGRTPEAIALFDKLLAAYPQGPLAESAAARRMTLLRQVDPAAAALAARRYLDVYPNGFAREEASGIATTK